VKVAVLGTGTMGALHAELLAACDDVDEILVADLDPARAEAAARAGGGRAIGPDEVWSTADAVIIATPAEVHAPAVEAAVAANVPALCEKPIAATLADSIRLTELVESRGATLQLGFQRRFDAGFAEAHRLVTSGELGALHLLRLTAHDPRIDPSLRGDAAPEVAPLFLHSSVHDFDMARWLSGQEVDEVHVAGTRRDDPYPAASDLETAVVTMRLDGGTLAVLDATLLDPGGYDTRAELIGANDSAAVGLGPRTPMRRLDPPATPEERWDHYRVRFRDAYAAELVAFLGVARGERPSPVTARDGLEALRIAVAATRSYIERRAVRLDEIPGLATEEGRR
jgi:myo-inositol 2-dehydrogenase/D-chiro-inositol 1-dehydrogenase